MMFQGYALYPHLSLRDIAGRVMDVARLLDINRLLDQSIQQVSGGEQQRAAIGRAIIQKPDLYLLDEPISNLDASLREAARTEVLEGRPLLGLRRCLPAANSSRFLRSRFREVGLAYCVSVPIDRESSRR